MKFTMDELKRVKKLLSQSEDYAAQQMIQFLTEILNDPDCKCQFDLINRESYFATNLWYVDDIRAALTSKGFCPIKENLDEIEYDVRSVIQNCEVTWECIDCVIDNHASFLKKNVQVVSITDNVPDVDPSKISNCPYHSIKECKKKDCEQYDECFAFALVNTILENYEQEGTSDDPKEGEDLDSTTDSDTLSRAAAWVIEQIEEDGDLAKEITKFAQRYLDLDANERAVADWITTSLLGNTLQGLANGKTYPEALPVQGNQRLFPDDHSESPASVYKGIEIDEAAFSKYDYYEEPCYVYEICNSICDGANACVETGLAAITQASKICTPEQCDFIDNILMYITGWGLQTILEHSR